MERKYKILAILLVVLAFGLVILPKSHDPREMDPKLLLSSVVDKSHYLSVDQVTHRIIENDPTLMLIDLRPADQFKALALPGSINIQPDSLMSNSNTELYRQPGKDKVLYANADLTAEKAWLICTRYSVNRIYVMKGGINEWFTTIIKEQTASPTASTTELDLISFRNAARQYFTGAGIQTKAPVTPTNEKIQVTRKAPAAKSGGGC
jgi:rhodanese-related sulfurtransferase